MSYTPWKHKSKTYRGCKILKFNDGSVYIKGKDIPKPGYPMRSGGFSRAKKYIDYRKKRR